MEDFEAMRGSFEKIHSSDAWGGGSGPGSLPSNTTLYRAFVENFIYENNIGTATDLGCGDWQFSRHINWSPVDYTGMEVVASLVESNNKAFGSATVRFILSENVDSLPGGDLLLCKEVLQHLPNDMIFAYLKAIREKYKFALITNSVAPGAINVDIAAGQYRPLRIDLPPFNVRGANVLTYFPYEPTKNQIWKNNVFLLVGDA